MRKHSAVDHETGGKTMKKAILATKVGMTQIFNENGVLVPVTVLQAGPCVVTQVKTCLLYTSGKALNVQSPYGQSDYRGFPM